MGIYRQLDHALPNFPFARHPPAMSDQLQILSVRSSSLCGKESKDLAHHAVCLICLEKELRVCRAINDDQLFWFGSFLVLRANLGEPWPIFVGIIAGHNEQRTAFELLGRTVWVGAQEYQAIDLTWLGTDRRRAGGRPPILPQRRPQSSLSSFGDSERLRARLSGAAHSSGQSRPDLST